MAKKISENAIPDINADWGKEKSVGGAGQRTSTQAIFIIFGASRLRMTVRNTSQTRRLTHRCC